MVDRVVFIGPGRAGLAVGQALQDGTCPVHLEFWGRRPEAPHHPLFDPGGAEYLYGIQRPAEGTTAVILAVPDRAIPEIAALLAGHGPAPNETAALHLSGAFDTDVLAPLHAMGYAVGTLHPLQSLADPTRSAEWLPDSWFAVSGEPTALRVARRLVGCIGARTVTVQSGRRSLYHAAAALTSMAIPTILETAERLFLDAGVDPEDALPALAALATGTLRNAAQRPGVTITGPLARGDAETVRLHLAVLDGEARELYLAVARQALALVRDELSPVALGMMTHVLESAWTSAPPPPETAVVEDP